MHRRYRYLCISLIFHVVTCRIRLDTCTFEYYKVCMNTPVNNKIQDLILIPVCVKNFIVFACRIIYFILIHAYIIQCNDRQYGDSRIRVPHKDSWMRDLVRLKGGKNDYFVVGEIDIISLRAFQTSHRSPCGPFKPVPDGFSIAFERQTLAQTDEEQRDK